MLLYSGSDRFLIGAIVIHVSEHFREICDKRQHDLAQQQVSVSVHPPLYARPATRIDSTRGTLGHLRHLPHRSVTPLCAQFPVKY